MAKKKVEEISPLEALREIYADKIYGAKDLPSARKNPINSGSIILNSALGIGGHPRGRIIEVYGPESCISGDSFIRYDVMYNNKRINNKGGTIKHLYERFHDMREGKPGNHLARKNVNFVTSSENEKGFIIKNEILDVIKTGIKPVFLLKTKGGLSIKATVEHKFKTPDGFVPLEKLKAGSVVMVHVNTTNKGRKHYPRRKQIMVKNHPIWRDETIKENEKTYIYKRTELSRFCYEAYLNNMTTVTYRKFLNSKNPDFSNIKLVPSNMHIHHIDENFTNNSPENLLLISPREHGKLHSKDVERLKNLSFITTEDIVESIEFAGEEETYDLKCNFPYNNYTANQFIVHNSGKTALGYHMLRNVKGPIAVIDAEKSYDPADPEMYGVNMDNLFILKPESIEDAMEMACDLANKGIEAFMFDSIAGIATEAELASDISDETKMGDKAKRMSKLMRQLPTLCEKNQCTAYFVNQIREKMNNPGKVTPGGYALQFAASIRVEIKYTESFPSGSDNPEGMYLHIFTKKNKLSSPYKKAKLPFLYGHGISKEMEILEIASQQDIIVKKGSWYSYNESALGQGVSNTRQMLEDNPELCEEIFSKIDPNLIILEKLFK